MKVTTFELIVSQLVSALALQHSVLDPTSPETVKV